MLNMRAAAIQSECETEIHPHDLPSLLDRYPDITVLSLDCFDTLLWRKTATPIGVFYYLQQQPTFKSLGFDAQLRHRAENNARQFNKLDYQSTEVNLQEIYQALYPQLTETQLEMLINEELQSEQAMCYGFLPVRELIREAHARKLKIIIVSDTYLNREQLQDLLVHCIPLEAGMIDTVFCSSEYRRAKHNGLFTDVLQQLGLPGESILHLGDNKISDLQAACKAGINALQLNYHNDALNELNRMQIWSALMMDANIRHKRPLYSPFQAIYASTPMATDNPASMIGYASLGPIMFAFANFILATIERLQQQGKRTKVVFLMRDAYLPALACEALTASPLGAPVRISRFAAIAASLCTEQDVNRYLVNAAPSLRFQEICAQLLLPDELKKIIIAFIKVADNPVKAFISLVRQESIMTTILSEAKNYRQRLITHINHQMPLEKGDTLVFVDLGYTGTAQQKLMPVFKEELGVDIYGCYLIALATANWQESRCGLIDPSWCDDRQLTMLVTYIALLEQLCTATDNSVIDFDELGLPIFSPAGTDAEQHGKLKQIQSECVRFVESTKELFAKSGLSFSEEMLRDSAMAEICRLIFMPTKLELDFLKSFAFDLNLGTQDLLPMFDEAEGLSGLRKRGLLFMETNLSSMRTNYPAELRSAGMELSFTLMATHRFGLNPRMKDMSLRSESVTLSVYRNNESFATSLKASPTYDGYYALIIPVCNGQTQMKVEFGARYAWVQIDSVEYIQAAALYSQRESEYTFDAWEDISFNEINAKENGLLECISNSSAVILTPSLPISMKDFVLRIVFRPLAQRSLDEIAN